MMPEIPLILATPELLQQIKQAPWGQMITSRHKPPVYLFKNYTVKGPYLPTKPKFSLIIKNNYYLQNLSNSFY